MNARHGLLLAILLASLAVRVAAGFWWQARLPDDVKFALPDSESYWELGRAIGGGRPYQYPNHEARIIRTPGYPLLLAGLFVASDEPPVIWARMLGAVLGTLAVGGVIWWTRLLFDWPTALLAGTFAAFYPGAVAMSVFVLSEAPFVPLMVGQLILWSAAWRSEGKRRYELAFAAGLVAALATLMRPSWLLFTPFAICFAVACCPRRGRHIAVGATVMLGLIGGMSPWWIRNYRVCGHFVPTTLQVGASLYDGLSPAANGASQMDFAVTFYNQQKKDDRAAAVPPEDDFEWRLDRRMRAASIAWARQNPASVARLAGIKFIRMWNLWPNAEELRGWKMRAAITLGYAPLLVLGMIGVVRFARRDWPYLLCFVPAIYFTCLHVVFVSSIRYRQPAMLCLIVLAAATARQLMTLYRQPTTSDSATNLDVPN